MINYYIHIIATRKLWKCPTQKYGPTWNQNMKRHEWFMNLTNQTLLLLLNVVTIEMLMEKCFPLMSTLRHSTVKLWINDKFRGQIRRRQRAFMTADMEQFRKCWNLVNHAAPKLRRDDTNRRFLSWRIIPPAIGGSTWNRWLELIPVVQVIIVVTSQ